MKPISKQAIIGMMTLTLLLQVSPNALADTVVTSSVPVVQMPGNYNQMNSAEILRSAEGLTLNDRKFISDTVMKINSAVVQLINDHELNGLTELSENSNTAGSIKPDIQEFLGLRRSYQTSLNSIKSLIDSLTSIPEIGAQNQRNITIQGDKILIDGSVKADFTQSKADAHAKLKEIDDKIERLRFTLIHPNKGFTTQVGVKELNPDLQNPFTVEQLNQMRNKAAEYRLPDAQINRQIDTTINQYTVESMKTLRKVFGDRTKLTLAVGSAESLQKNAIAELEQIMFSRSLLRIMYGIKTGVPNFMYQIRKFNWDFFASSNELGLTGGVTRDQNKIKDLMQSANSALSTQESRIQDVFGSNVNAIYRLTSAWNFIKGERNISTLNAVIITMLIKDMKEDELVGTFGGLRQLKDSFAARYYSNPEDLIKYTNLTRDIVAVIEPQAVESSDEDDGFGDVAAGENGIIGVLKFAGTAFKSRRALIEQANQMDATIATYESSSQGVRDTKKRVNAIINMQPQPKQ